MAHVSLMESDKTSRPRNQNIGSNQHLELKNIASNGNDMNRYRRTNCTIQPGSSTPTTGVGASQKRSPFRASLRSDTVSSLDQTFVSFRDVDSAKRFYHRRLRILSSLSCAMGILAAVCAILDIEVTRIRQKRITETRQLSKANGVSHLIADDLGLAGMVLKGTISLLSILTCITLYRIYMNTRKLYVVKNLYHESESFFTSSLLLKYCIETFVCFIHVPPLVDNLGVRYIHKLQLLVFLRLYLVTRCVKERSQLFNNQATNLLASVTKTEISSRFLVKTFFLKEPFLLIFTFYTLNVFLGGYCVYVIEDKPPYLDTVWMMVVTMTTLGFGDVVPLNVFARGFVGFASVLGIFLMALFISVVHETLQLTQQEKRILAYIENAEHLRKKKAMSARCIQSCWRYRSFIKRHGNAIEIGDWLKLQRAKYLQHKFFETMRQWRTIRRAWTRDDYWKKFFIVDDTAMLLTDVCRTLNKIERQMGNRNSSKGSKNSLYKNPSFYSHLPKKQDPQECDRIFEYPSISFQTSLPSPCYHPSSVQAVLIDSWKSPAVQQQQQEKEEEEKRDKPVIRQVEPRKDMPKLSNNNLENSTPVGQEETRNKRPYLLKRPEFIRKTSDLSTSSDHIDRGAMPMEMLQSRIDSVEDSLDQIYGKVKGELRDIRDAIRTLTSSTAPVRTPMWSPAITSKDGENPRADPIFSYANIEKYDI